MITDISTFEIKAVPNKLICNNSIYPIILNNLKYIIYKFAIFQNENHKIEKIMILNGHHPNCDPKTQEFCIPDTIKQIDVINHETLKIIIDMFKIFNFNSSFFQPWDDFEMEGDMNG